jgi:exopolyphosphatase/guanosine-5'-triphosphate,3'-diphosphate pyrophosphatase
VLLEELLRHAGLDRIAVSDRALREGLVIAALERPADRAPADVRGRQVRQLAERAPSVLLHAEHTAKLALRLFDLTPSLHRLGPREREWLEHAALLHDVGYAVDYERHHKHGYYLITNAALDAFDPREIEVIAHVAPPRRRAVAAPRLHAALRGWQRTIEALALLRRAEALDRATPAGSRRSTARSARSACASRWCRLGRAPSSIRASAAISRRCSAARSTSARPARAK